VPGFGSSAFKRLQPAVVDRHVDLTVVEGQTTVHDPATQSRARSTNSGFKYVGLIRFIVGVRPPSMISRSSSPQLSVGHGDNLYKCVSIFVIRSGRAGHERFISEDDAWVALDAEHARLKADGTFRIDNLFPGQYDVWVSGLQPSSYIKEARLGVVDVLTESLQIDGPESRTLEILLSLNVGAMDGTATDQFGSVPGAQILLVPNRSRHRHQLFRAVTADQNGRFSIPNVVPGDYKLFAWEAIEPYSWFDAEVLARYESRARPIHVAERSRQTVEVSVGGSVGRSGGAQERAGKHPIAFGSLRRGRIRPLRLRRASFPCFSRADRIFRGGRRK
jgi:hypothetical protein